MRTFKLLLACAAVGAAICGLASLGCDAGYQGQLCWSQSQCGYGEICVKEHDWSPSGRCVKGSLP
jgi:hypothetical protein